MHTVVDESPDRRSSDMKTGIAGSVVDEHGRIVSDLTTCGIAVGYPTIGEDNIHHITDILLSFRDEEPSTGLGNDAGGVVEGRHIHI